MYRYVQGQGQGWAHLSKYLISDLIFQIVHSYMKKSSKSSLRKRFPDISLQHKNEASYKLKKKKTFALGRKKVWS